MPEEKKESLHPEITFLPPLEMILSSLNPEERQRAKTQETKKNRIEETSVVKLIEKLENKK